MRETDLPIRDRSTFPDDRERASASVHGVLLAAGTSARYGDANKLLQTVDGAPVVRRAVETLVQSVVDDVTVVVGYESDRVREAIADLDVRVKENEEYATGQSSSLRTGISEADGCGSDAALVALGDMPWIEPETVDTLVEAYRRGISDLLVAAYDSQRGNPVLFDSRFFDVLVDIQGDVGGKSLVLESEDTVAIETSDPGVVRDVDRETDLPE